MSLYMFYFNYILGYYYYKKNYIKSSMYYAKALRYNKIHAKCNFKLGMSYFKQQKWDLAVKSFKAALILQNNTAWAKQLKQAENHIKSNSKQFICNSVEEAINIENISSKNKNIRILIGELQKFYKEKRWWVVVNYCKQILELENNIDINFVLVNVLFNMKKYKECEILLNKLVILDDIKIANKLDCLYKLGLCYTKKGIDNNIIDYDKANIYYEQLIKLDDNLNIKRYGIGEYHKKYGFLDLAVESYIKIYNENKENSYINNYYKYPINDDELCYKIANIYDEIGDVDSAIKYYLKVLEINYQRPYTHFSLAINYEYKNDYKNALKFYKEAIDRKNEHRSYWYYRLILACNVLGIDREWYIKDIYPGFFKTNHKSAKYDKNKIMNLYTYYYENLQVADNMILYESYHGVNMSCNPYAIFKYLINDERFRDFKHIWIFKDNHDNIPIEYKKLKNFYLVKKNSDLYAKYLAQAKFLFNNSTFPEYFIRKEEQIYVNTWHGTPIKYMGYRIKEVYDAFANTQRNFLHATHIVMPNRYTTNIFLKDYGLKNLFNGKICEIGYPRIDLTLNNSNNKLITELNLDPNKKTILYAPTFRGDYKFNDENAEILKVADLLNSLVLLQEYNIIYRGHYTKNSSVLANNVIIPSSQLDTNELLSIVDILITDYSSIAFDFIATKKPIIFYVYDLQDYIENRGLYFNIKHISNNVYKTSKEVVDCIINIKYDFNIKENIYKKFSYLNEGNSSQKIIDIVFFNSKNGVTTYKQKDNLLFYPGALLANGITRTFITLLYEIKKSGRYNPITICENINTEDKEFNFQFIKKYSDIVIKKDTINTLPQERIKFDNLHIKSDNFILQREIKRLFGDLKFICALDYDGYTGFWTKLFSLLETKKIIWQHNSMYEEYIVRFPQLMNVFGLYNKFSSVLSVSESTKSLNISNFNKYLNINTKNFDYIDNLINYKEILFKSNESIEDFVFDINKKYFINIGRLSVEKDQEKLIRAFYEIYKTRKDIALIILGQGPLEGQLKVLIRDLKLQKSVFLLGQKRNPYKYLKNADCFVFSSIHEGAGMVLFESMVLKKPIICTDIIACRSVMKNRGGIMVENSIKGLVYGMNEYLNGNIVVKDFDYIKYNKEALDRFYKILEKDCM